MLGTYSQNQTDAYKRNRRRQPKGHLHANAKLTALEVQYIRGRYPMISQQQLADYFFVSQRCISLIIRGETYRAV